MPIRMSRLGLLRSCLLLTILFACGCKQRALMGDESNVNAEELSDWDKWHKSRMDDLNARQKEISNLREAILAAQEEVRLVLKRRYLAAYNGYVHSYLAYVKALEQKYRMESQLRKSLMYSYGLIKKYQSQAKICSTRSMRLWRSSLGEANIELWTSEIHSATVAKTLRALASEIRGEECVHKVLLDWEASRKTSMGMNSELLGIHFVKTDTPGLHSGLICPHNDAEFQPALGPDGAPLPFGAAEYPPVKSLPEKNTTVYYMPFTYFQMYQLLSDFTASFEIAPPPAGNAPACDPRHPKNKLFYNIAHRTETDLAVEFKDYQRGTIKTGRYRRIPSAHHGNKSYEKLFASMQSIFEAVDACIGSNFDKAITPPAVLPQTPDRQNVVVFANGGITGGAPGAQPSNPLLNFTFDPSLPEMSDSIRDCFILAESYRQQAFENTAVVTDVIGALKAAGVDPPVIPQAPNG